MSDDEDTFARLERHMALSQTIGAPVRNIPERAVEVVELVTPYLVEHTTPREAAVVMAAVYAYFATFLTRDTNTPEEAIKQAHDLLDAAITIVGDIYPIEED